MTNNTLTGNDLQTHSGSISMPRYQAFRFETYMSAQMLDKLLRVIKAERRFDSEKKVLSVEETPSGYKRVTLFVDDVMALFYLGVSFGRWS